MTVATDRIAAELGLLQGRWPDLEFVEDGRWIRVPRYPVPIQPAGWNRTECDVVIQVHPAHPGQPPYGLYVPSGMRFSGQMPQNYQEPAGTQPPFPGEWGVFSWTIEGWAPGSDIRGGSNLLNWVAGLAHRFREGV